MINNRQTLLAYLAQGHTVKYLHFWGHIPKNQANGIGQSCLSQWFPADFQVNEHTYLTAEHYMMAQKARLFADDKMLQAILTCQHPAEAKKLGRQVTPFEQARWEQHCFQYVVEGNFAKFSQNASLKAFLLATHNRILVEASPRDHIWGIGMAASDPNANNPEQWRGKNWLGFALMEVRHQLQVA